MPMPRVSTATSDACCATTRPRSWRMSGKNGEMYVSEAAAIR
jgi:hypothetical protein